MRITLVDDSVPFDARSPARQALGGAQKLFAGLPGAFFRSGHAARVFNRGTAREVIEGASWEGWTTPPLRCDALIAYRRPALLDFVRDVERKRLLWLADPVGGLNSPAMLEFLDARKPGLIFQSEAQRATWKDGVALSTYTIAPFVGWHFRQQIVPQPVSPPRAVCTAHPLHGVGWLIRLWIEHIRPAAPTAELHVFSASLQPGRVVPAIDPNMQALLSLVRQAAAHGVVVREPAADPAMAGEFRKARVHLHPSDANEMLAMTLVESQATGLPAVTRPLGAAPERIDNGETGIVTADDGAFAQAAIALLSDDAHYLKLSESAQRTKRARTADSIVGFYEVALS